MTSAGPRTRGDLQQLKAAGVNVLVRLAHDRETGISFRGLRAAEIEDAYFPMEDFTAPAQDRLDAIVGVIADRLAHNRVVAVSCLAGQGRTGTALACFLVSQGLSREDALAELVGHRPGIREVRSSAAQVEAIDTFAARLRSGALSIPIVARF